MDAVTGKEVEEDDEAKGYQRGENDYTILEDEELENVALDSPRRTIDIEVFTPRDSFNGSGSTRPIICRRMIRSARRPSL